jgi:hypothetical protein
VIQTGRFTPTVWHTDNMLVTTSASLTVESLGELGEGRGFAVPIVMDVKAPVALLEHELLGFTAVASAIPVLRSGFRWGPSRIANGYRRGTLGGPVPLGWVVPVLPCVVWEFELDAYRPARSGSSFAEEVEARVDGLALWYCDLVDDALLAAWVYEEPPAGDPRVVPVSPPVYSVDGGLAGPYNAPAVVGDVRSGEYGVGLVLQCSTVRVLICERDAGGRLEPVLAFTSSVDGRVEHSTRVLGIPWFVINDSKSGYWASVVGPGEAGFERVCRFPKDTARYLDYAGTLAEELGIEVGFRFERQELVD